MQLHMRGYPKRETLYVIEITGASALHHTEAGEEINVLYEIEGFAC